MSTVTEKTFTCKECERPFAFSIDEQQFFLAKGLINNPKRCHDCRILARMRRTGQGADATTQVTCDGCGCVTRVPFKPKGIGPVFCSPCFKTRRGMAVVVAETAIAV